MQTGYVKCFDAVKGFGFLTAEDDKQDYFVHHTGIIMEGYRELYQGQHVSFDTVEGNKPGTVMAANVTVIDQTILPSLVFDGRAGHTFHFAEEIMSDKRTILVQTYNKWAREHEKTRQRASQRGTCSPF